MPKRDYFDDPHAPAPNSIVPAVTAAVLDEHGRLLLIKRGDNGLWAMPGGALDLGESLAQAVHREVVEETGIEVEAVDILGVYSNPGHVIAYDDGEVRQEFSICFLAEPRGGELRTSDESKEVIWVEPSALTDLDMSSAMRLRINHALDPDRSNVHIG